MVLLALCLWAWGGLRADAVALTNALIEQKQNQIQEAQEERERLQGGLTDVKAIKKNLEAKKTNLEGVVVTLDQEMTKIEDNIENLRAQILAKDEEIRLTEEELAQALAQEASQLAAMKARIRFLYEQGQTYVWDVLLGSGDFVDVLNKAEYVESLYAYDRRMWDGYQAQRVYVELTKEQLETQKDILDRQRQQVEAEQAALDALLEEKSRQLQGYVQDIQNKEEAIAAYEEYIREQNAVIAALEAAVAEEKRRLASQASAIRYDGGMFKFPMASYSRISDDFGMRMHPILRVERFHAGVDFAAPAGTSIYAAYDGIVVAADYNATMGNYVMIDHGDSLYTIYMHCSSLFVSKGAGVAKGDTIASVGTTGRSTGNHLHFGVRLNGNYVSPWNYLSQ